MTNETSVIAYNDPALIKCSYLIVYFLARKQQSGNRNMYTAVSAVQIVGRYKDVRGVAFTVIWVIAAIIQKHIILQVAIMMLITGALGL